jgi:alpha-1,6-mannosyltransferase
MHRRFIFPIVSIAFLGLTIFLGYFAQRTDFQTFIAAFAVCFGLYLWLVFYPQKHFSASETRYWIWLGIGLRVVLLFSIPNLSDDYARFLWDGHLTVAGIHPFVHTPAYFMDNQIFPKGITPELFGKLNSPGFFTVYPPVCQAVFALAAWLFPFNELGGVIVMKLFLLACEFGTIYLLSTPKDPGESGLPTFSKLTNLNGASSLIYALNPLIILEICGNCHFEGAMICFLLTGITALKQRKVVKGAIWWAFATATKMLPILFLPILWRWLGWRKGWKFNLMFSLACLVLFAPLLAVLPNILESLDLYFRKFQFNASVYYLVREVGILKTGWDIGVHSGPILGGLTTLGVLIIAWRTKQFHKGEPTCSMFSDFSGPFGLNTAMFFALFLYLSFSATIQPWYVAVPLALSLGTNWRFILAWSGLVVLSYSHYDGGARQEHYGLIILEYGLIWIIFLWEARQIFLLKPTRISS